MTLDERMALHGAIMDLGCLYRECKKKGYQDILPRLDAFCKTLRDIPQEVIAKEGNPIEWGRGPDHEE